METTVMLPETGSKPLGAWIAPSSDKLEKEGGSVTFVAILSDEGVSIGHRQDFKTSSFDDLKIDILRNGQIVLQSKGSTGQSVRSLVAPEDFCNALVGMMRELVEKKEAPGAVSPGSLETL